jgi:chain length determinant protein EpsF
MNWRQILTVVRLRWWLVLLLFVLTVAVAFAVAINLSKRYSATTTVLLDIKTDPLVATLAPNLAAPAYMATQMEILRSDRLATRVVKMLGLAQNPAVVAQWREETNGRVPVDEYFGELMQRGLAVDQGKNSAVLHVSYTASDPRFAAAVANTFARAYLDLSVEFRVGPAREYATFFDERLKQLRGELESAQQRVSAYQKTKGLIVSAERLDMETSRLTSLEGAYAAALTESAETISRSRNSGSETSVDIQQSGVVQGLKGELARAETRLNEISTNYGANHPVRIQLDAQIAELKQQIAREMRRVSGATSNVNRIATSKLNELKNLIDTQKKMVLTMRTERDEASVLLRDLEAAQRAYDTVAQRRSQLANESQSEQATARILSTATEPLNHSFPIIPRILAMAALGGLLLGVAAAVVWELLDRRIRGEEDIQMVDGVPVLGVMSSRATKGGYVRRLPTMRPPPGLPQLTLEGERS